MAKLTDQQDLQKMTLQHDLNAKLLTHQHDLGAKQLQLQTHSPALSQTAKKKKRSRGGVKRQANKRARTEAEAHATASLPPSNF